MRASLAAPLNLDLPCLRDGIKAPMVMLITRQPTTLPVVATAGTLTPAAALATVAAPAVAQTVAAAPVTAAVGAVATSLPVT